MAFPSVNRVLLLGAVALFVHHFAKIGVQGQEREFLNCHNTTECASKTSLDCPVKMRCCDGLRYAVGESPQGRCKSVGANASHTGICMCCKTDCVTDSDTAFKCPDVNYVHCRARRFLNGA